LLELGVNRRIRKSAGGGGAKRPPLKLVSYIKSNLKKLNFQFDDSNEIDFEQFYVSNSRLGQLRALAKAKLVSVYLTFILIAITSYNGNVQKDMYGKLYLQQFSRGNGVGLALER